MIRRFQRVLIGILTVFLALSAVLAAFGVYTVRRGFPQAKGEIRLAGLDGPVEIYRDQFGIPQVYASTQHDLFLAQGYVHAQDRFWQMDFWRHIGSGRLAEMFGTGQLESDRFLRTLRWAHIAEQELATLDATSLAILTAYAEGVNAYLADHQGSAIGLEYAVLKLLNPAYQPEPWQPLHSLTWAKVMAWDLRGNIDDEIERLILLKNFSSEQIAQLYPAYPADRPVIVTQSELASRSAPAEARRTDLPVGPDALPVSEAQLRNLQSQIRALESLTGEAGAGIGSNSWVISGKLTSTGKPFLANDPHLSAQLPSIWYEVGLHCQPKGAECPYEVTGVSFAGIPGVVIGHTDRIAWGFTNVGPDVMDLFIEKVNPENLNQYEVNGAWVDMQLVQETLQVAGGEPVQLTVRYTRHGPLITDTYLDPDFAEQAGLDLDTPYAVALRWTALEPGYTFRAIWKFNRAQNWEEFRAAAQDFTVPSQNLVYADVDGNIGYQMPGNIPIRANGSGVLPAPGWSDDYEWIAYIPFEDLPAAYNPPKGYIATANNAVVGPDYPRLISLDWDYGYRAERIVAMIEQAPGPIDAAYIQKMQGDDLNLNTAALVPVLAEQQLPEGPLKSAQALLSQWDDQQTMESNQAALFEVFWRRLLADTFQDDLPEDYWPGGSSRWYEVMRHLVQDPESAWWDDQATPQVERRDQIFQQALAEALTELEQKLGKDPASWAWGDLHTLTLRSETFGNDPSPTFIQALFNRGPYRTAGGASIVNATSWDANLGYEVQALPSMRMIVDLSNLESSLAIHTTGQSGHPFHANYTDMTDLWRNIGYHPQFWTRTQVEANARFYLQLLPDR